MEILEYSYRFAKEILEHPRYKCVYNEIIEICQNVPTPIYKDKSSSQPKLDVVQQLINTYFKLAFKEKGWELEPFATPEKTEDSLRGDFRKTFILDDKSEITVQIEVEMGNIASSYRNYFKFQLSYSYDITDICILILPSGNLATRIDSGVASFEKTRREIPSAKLSVTVPILVIGLNPDVKSEWDLRKEDVALDVLKGSTIPTKEEHEKLVLKYLKKLKTNKT